MGDVLGLGEDDPVTDIIYDKVYENFVEEIDAIDNGVNQYDGEPRLDMLFFFSRKYSKRQLM